MATVNDRYTQDDHQFRDEDEYAAAKYRWTLRRLGRANSRTLLNVGCGAGLFNALAEARGFRLTAIEPDPEAFKVAQKRAMKESLIINTSLFAFEPSQQFDVIVLHDVLEHIEDESSAVRRLSELLKPKGILIGSVPALQSLFGRHDEELGHFRRYRKRSLRSSLSHEFRVDRIRYFGLSGIPFVWYFSRLRRKPYPLNNESGGKNSSSRLLKTICTFEEKIVPPVGTSLLFEANPRSRS